MTADERSLLQQLDRIVRSEQVRVQSLPIVERVRAELTRKQDALMAWEPIALTLLGDALPAAIRSGWVFILRAGANTGAERHPNSHQRMMSFEGTGNMQTDAESADRSGRAAFDIAWKSNVLVSDTEADRKSTRLNSSHGSISYAVFCLKKKKRNKLTDSIQ